MNDVKQIISDMTDLKNELGQLKKEKKDIIQIQNEKDMWKKKYEDLNKLYKSTWF